MKGKVIILCAPSGSGKTTLAKFLISKEKFNLKFSVSATTRKKRISEKNNIDYHFISPTIFKNKIKDNEFIEFEKVYDGVYYGTLKSEGESLINDYNIIFDVDVAGAESLKKYFSSKSISIFIKPPSIDELNNRLEKRGLNTKNELKERLKKAKKEMLVSEAFDYIITNDKLEKAKKQIYDLVENFLSN